MIKARRRFSLAVMILLSMLLLTIPAAAGEIYREDQITFVFSGGSGRITINCSEVEVNGEEILATVCFSKSSGHGSASYDTVKVDGIEYAGENVFTVPVQLNEYTVISGRTLAMSEPHWVDYRIFVSVDGTVPEEETEIDPDALKEMRGTKEKEEEPEIADTEDSADIDAYYSDAPEGAPEISGLTAIGKMPLDFAENFAVYLYEGGYKLIDIPESGRFLIVPEGKTLQADAGDDFCVLQAPVDHVYLAATSVMSLVCAVDALARITMTGTRADGWNIPEPAEALENGSLIYAGKYSEPDYETLVGNDCHLAIESTMIAHSPEVKEMLEAIDIPVFIDRSSYEAGGLGRTEWIKAYGALFDAEQMAFKKFEEQKTVVSDMAGYEETDFTVAIVSVGQDGTCVIRRPDDYIAAMIKDAGGNYVFEDYTNLEGGGATVTISMEEFYSMASDADFLVYNGTITGAVEGAENLLDASELFSDFKAFQEGNLWQIDSGLYQSTDKVAQLIRDFHNMLTGGDETDMVFLRKIG